MFRVSKLFVSIFGIGFFPLASGTMGSLVSIIFFYSIHGYFTFFNLTLIFLVFFFISIKAIDHYSNFINECDSSEIVIDEFLGIFLIIIFFDYYKFSNDFIMFSLIFFIFRFFDIVKVYPANWIDKNLKNSIGVICDDLIAALYTLATLFILNALF